MDEKMREKTKTLLKFKKDKRDKLWAKLELKIQQGAKNKDKNFRLTGRWKKFVRKQDGLDVYIVDGDWVRRNLSVMFGHGGHGYVHEFIPHNEIWIVARHFKNCGCREKNNQKLSKAYFDSTVLHEIIEYKKMRQGMTYWRAHQIALEKEREAGILKNVPWGYTF